MTDATDAAFATSLHIGTATVERMRKRFVEGNLEGALTERPRLAGTPKLDRKAEATLLAWACSTPPDEAKVWTIQLLADKLPVPGVQRSDASIATTVRRNGLTHI